MGRPYVGWDGNAPGKRAGTEKFIKLLCEYFNNGIWNNGSWGVRKMNNPRVTAWSVHGTGRAFDVSWRKYRNKGFGNYDEAVKVVEFLAENAELFQIMELHDYYPKPYGRGWRCDRESWRIYDKPTIGSAPGGDWFHVEVSPAVADNEQFFIDAFASLKGEAPAPAVHAPEPAVSAVTQPSVSDMSDGHSLGYPGESVNLGDKDKHVKIVQEKVGVKADGDFGPVTEQAVKEWQAANGLTPDGVVGPKTWKVMFGSVSVAPTSDYPGSPVQKGSRGDAARKVQIVVGATPDGYFGPATERRVKAWQRNNGLTADGVVGPKTWAKMF